MSETVNHLIDERLRNDVWLRSAFQTMPIVRHQVEWMRGVLDRVEEAMRAAGVPWDAAQQVLRDTVSGMAPPPSVPPSSPEEAMRRMDREIAEHADRTVEFLFGYEAGPLPTDDVSVSPARPDEEPT